MFFVALVQRALVLDPFSPSRNPFRLADTIESLETFSSLITLASLSLSTKSDLETASEPVN